MMDGLGFRKGRCMLPIYTLLLGLGDLLLAAEYQNFKPNIDSFILFFLAI